MIDGGVPVTGADVPIVSVNVFDLAPSIVRVMVFVPAIMVAFPVRVSVPLLLVMVTLKAVTPAGQLSMMAGNVPLLIPFVVTVYDTEPAEPAVNVPLCGPTVTALLVDTPAVVIIALRCSWPAL